MPRDRKSLSVNVVPMPFVCHRFCECPTPVNARLRTFTTNLHYRRQIIFPLPVLSQYSTKMNETPIKISVLAVSTRICLSYHISDNCESFGRVFYSNVGRNYEFSSTFCSRFTYSCIYFLSYSFGSYRF